MNLTMIMFLMNISYAFSPMFCYVQAYGVQMNGYVERDGQKLLWIGKRSQVKHTYPGMLDQLVAGGLVCNDQIMIKNLRRVEI